jgi:hypothetical protein
MVDEVSGHEHPEIARVRQFGLYPLWTQGNLRRVNPSKKLLLSAVRRIENVAYNGETRMVYWRYIMLSPAITKGNTVGSRSKTDLAYIAGFLDGDGSLMLQLKRRSDTKRAWRFMCTICFYQDTRHETPLIWIQQVLGIGYISRRNDGMTELRINGFKRVESILQDLLPYLRFKHPQALIMLEATELLSKTRASESTEVELSILIDLLLAIQSHNYVTKRKKTRKELRSLLGLTP